MLRLSLWSDCLDHELVRLTLFVVGLAFNRVPKPAPMRQLPLLCFLPSTVVRADLLLVKGDDVHLCAEAKRQAVGRHGCEPRLGIEHQTLTETSASSALDGGETA